MAKENMCILEVEFWNQANWPGVLNTWAIIGLFEKEKEGGRGLGGWGVGEGVEDMEFLRVLKKKHVEILAEIPEVY